MARTMMTVRQTPLRIRTRCSAWPRATRLSSHRWREAMTSIRSRTMASWTTTRFKLSSTRILTSRMALTMTRVTGDTNSRVPTRTITRASTKSPSTSKTPSRQPSKSTSRTSSADRKVAKTPARIKMTSMTLA